ncbi:MAG: invasion associated locus B family protein [Defluviicoccus sp.]|nr:invasion associated locus B family protein [Defluviicoccus sp.]
MIHLPANAVFVPLCCCGVNSPLRTVFVAPQGRIAGSFTPETTHACVFSGWQLAVAGMTRTAKKRSAVSPNLLLVMEIGGRDRLCGKTAVRSAGSGCWPLALASTVPLFIYTGIREVKDSMRSILILVVILAMASPALAAPKSLGKFGDWAAFVDGSDKRKVCYIFSAPKKAEGKYKTRDPVFLLVSHRPGDKVTNEISVDTGYDYKTNSEATAAIAGRSFKMFTKGKNAWNSDAQADRAMLEAMKTGSEIVIKGASQRGTLTTDTYSLMGFSAALAAISKACEVK